jgi:hypothetical protein
VGPAVTALPEAERERFAFQEPLIPEETAAELTPTPTLQEIRAQALELTAGRYLSGLSRLRLHAPSASHVYRWNRAEGSFVGLGFAWRPSGARALKARGGWAFGPNEPALALAVESADGRVGVEGTWNELRDFGPFPGQIGVLNTISALTASDDWMDPWFSSGVRAFLGGASLRVERHDSARTVLDADDAGDFRPLPRIEEGWLGMLELTHERTLRPAVSIVVTGRGGAFDPEGAADARAVGGLLGSLAWEHTRSGAVPQLTARVDGGLALGDVPPQQLFYLGGRGTLPGHPFREQVADAFWLARANASVPVFGPWVAARAFAAAGGVSGGSTQLSAGPGVGLAWDVIHLELGRGLDGGEWELVVSVDRRFRGWL